ncbi:MAG: DUF3108 domain-containing protein [Cycloclasticus sp.]|nr:DUF3108 domain-containing protein [Cycloclasticus sp.]
MNSLLKKSHLFFFTLALLCFSTQTFALTHVIPTFKAEYKLSHNNIEIGRVSLTVKRLASGQYQLKSSTQTSGLLAFIRDDDVVETSLFELTNKHIRPLSYQYQQSLGDEQKNISLKFDWQKNTLLNSSKGQDWTLDIATGVLDKALMQIALMLDLNDSKQTLSYQIADGGKLKTYAFTSLGTEEIDIQGKSYSTIKLARKKDDKPLITYYWCATELNNLPVLLRREKKYGTFEMRLINVVFDN